MKGFACEAKWVEFDWKNNREPLNDFSRGMTCRKKARLEKDQLGGRYFNLGDK